jgi:hypothetical protein
MIGIAISLGLLLIAYWVAISQKVVRISLDQNSYCEWRLNEWFTGKSVLSHYRQGAYTGTVRMNKGLFESPTAMFRGLQANTVICIYILDTTIAVFVVDFTPPPAIQTAPDSLRETVVSSNFPVRACTKAEVAYLKTEISSYADRLCDKTFGLFNCSARQDRLKQNLMRVVDLGTIPHSQRTGELAFEAHPQIPPEG